MGQTFMSVAHNVISESPIVLSQCFMKFLVPHTRTSVWSRNFYPYNLLKIHEKERVNIRANIAEFLTNRSIRNKCHDSYSHFNHYLFISTT